MGTEMTQNNVVFHVFHLHNYSTVVRDFAFRILSEPHSADAAGVRCPTAETERVTGITDSS